ncbi:hypothetical protein Emed_000347 [Eimeria media]
MPWIKLTPVIPPALGIWLCKALEQRLDGVLPGTAAAVAAVAVAAVVAGALLLHCVVQQEMHLKVGDDPDPKGPDRLKQMRPRRHASSDRTYTARANRLGFNPSREKLTS